MLAFAASRSPIVAYFASATVASILEALRESISACFAVSESLISTTSASSLSIEASVAVSFL